MAAPRVVLTTFIPLSLIVVCLLGSPLSGSTFQQQRLDAEYAAYVGGDHAAVERLFPRSDDFGRYRLFDEKRIERWLGAWTTDKAAFLLEVMDRAGTMAPAYLPSLARAGQRYIVRRPNAPGTSPREDEFERRYHVITLGILQRAMLGEHIVPYIDALRTRRPLPASAAVIDPRVALARGIGQELRCRLLHAHARHDRVLADLEGKAATPPAERQMAIDCMKSALNWLETAAERAEVRDEALTRAGFSAFQLGQNAEAKEALDQSKGSGDSTLTYWRDLFRGRVADAMGDDAEAERAYRGALVASREAHSARIGLALALFRLKKDDEAQDAARAVREVKPDAIDPWDIYFHGDGRFVPAWIAAMRKAR